MSWLQVSGTNIMKPSGEIVPLRIMALINWDFEETAHPNELLDKAVERGVKFVQLHFEPTDYCSYPPHCFDYATQIHIMDESVQLCKERGLYVILCYHAATTHLRNKGITTVVALKNHLKYVWTDLMTHYKDEPTVAGYRLIDEPNLLADDERDLWTMIIKDLREINPNAIWFTHVINVLRMGPQYWYMNPFHVPQDVPHPNIVQTGGVWISPDNPEFWPTTIDEANQIADTIEMCMQNFRVQVGIPTGITYGINGNFGTASEPELTLVHRLTRHCESKRYVNSPYIADYQLRGSLGLEHGEEALREVYPDVPYPDTWGGGAGPPGCIIAFLASGMGAGFVLPSLRQFRNYLPRILVRKYYQTSDRILAHMGFPS